MHFNWFSKQSISIYQVQLCKIIYLQIIKKLTLGQFDVKLNAVFCFFFYPFRSTILQQQFNRVGRVEHGSVALPGIIRSGSIGGPDTFNMGTMPSAQQQITTGQMHKGHMPPLVSESTYT